MAINLGSISAKTTKALALSNLVLVSPQSTVGYQPQNPPNDDGTPSTAEQPPALLFNYEGEQSILLESDITDHYVEDNSSRQDQIALKPEVVQTQGFIGELNNVPPPGLGLLKTITDRLTVLTAFAPGLTTTAQNVYNQASAGYALAKNIQNTAVSAWSSIKNTALDSNGQSVIGANGLAVAESQNRQQTAFQQFYGYWAARTLFTVQTPWCVIEDMAIQRVRPVQDAEATDFTTFEVTFKRIRTAKTQLTNQNGLGFLDGRAASQAAGITDLGVNTPVLSKSLSSGLSSMFG